jgi:hypothetical protein
MKRLRPADVVTHRRISNVDAKPRTFAELLEMSTQPLAQSVNGTSALVTANFVRNVQRVLGERLRDIDSRRAASLTAPELERLWTLRNRWREYLDRSAHSLARQPPSSGGETARWSLCTSFWLLVCHANYLLFLCGHGGDELRRFDPSMSAYLCRNRLVITHGPVSSYSLRTLDLALDTWLAALDSLDAQEQDYVRYMSALEHRFAALVCTSGSHSAGFDASECTMPQTDKSTGGRTDGAGDEAINGEYLAQTYWRFTALRHYLQAYESVGNAVVTQQNEQILISIRRPASSLTWAPSKRALFRLREFFCDLAATRMRDPNYETSLKAFVRQFEPYPGDAEIYRMMRQTHLAAPRSVLEYGYLHRSTVGTEYVRNTKYSRPVIEWLHDEADFRLGDSSVRSDARTRLAFHRQLAILQIVHSYIASSWQIEFRKRFVVFHRSANFFVGEQAARSKGFPYIVQQYGFWTVVVPHRVSPENDVFVLEKSHASEIARRDAETTRRLAHNMRQQERVRNRNNANDDSTDDNDADDDEVDDNNNVDRSRRNDDRGAHDNDDDDNNDEGSYSYEYEYESDTENLRDEMARLNIEIEDDERGAAFDLERMRTFGQRPPPPLTSIEAYIRAYDCETFFEAFALWCAAVLRINGGVIDDHLLTEFITDIFDWQLRQEAI